MRVAVFFDLPTNTKAERRAATQFRKFLLDDGFDMLQYSVYARLCPNHMHVIVGEKTVQEKNVPASQLAFF